MADIKNNYYGMLGLSAENYEGDPQKLSEIAEKKIKEWQSHKKIEIQNRANIHGPEIRKAIKDSVKWKSIYEEFVLIVMQQIEDALVLFVRDKKILKNNICEIAKQYNVSEEFVGNICKKRGYEIEGNVKSKTKAEFTLENLKPKSYLQLQEPQKAINELGANDLLDLLATQEISEVSITLSEKSSKEKVIEALDELEKKWRGVQQTGPKAHKKSHINRICSGFKKFLENNPFADYILYLKYLCAKDILDEIVRNKVKELSEEALNKTITRVTEFTEDIDKSRSLIEDYCASKNIALPAERVNYCLCPYPDCSASFIRSEPLQKNCPVCGKTFEIKCPKCGKPKNLLKDFDCDGINLGIYPHLAKKIIDIDDCCKVLNLSEAVNRLNDLNAQWPNYPGTFEAQNKINNLIATYDKELKLISSYCERKSYYSAKAIIDRIDGAFPGFKNRYDIVYKEIENAESAFNDAMSQTDKDKRLGILLTINDCITDFSRLNVELGKYTVEPVTDLSAEVDSYTGIITLKWKSANKPNSVFYSVRRKTDTMISSKNEGVEIAHTQNHSCSDNSIDEGVAYYYAVYAMRGPIESPLKALNTPSLMLKAPKLSVIPGDASLELIWGISNQQLKVFYSEKDIADYNEGTEITNLSATGVLIENLVNGKQYQISAYKIAKFGGVEYRSKLTVLNKVSPVKPITPPKITKCMGNKAGEYVLVDELNSNEALELYFTETLQGIVENKTISQFEMESKAKKLNVSKNSDGEFIIDMTGHKQMYVYPVYNVSGTLTVGNMLSLIYVEPVKVTANVSGSSLCLSLDKWPDGVEQIYICYSDNSFPQDITDCERANRIPISKSSYLKRPLLEIPNIRMMVYYISLIARNANNYIPIATLKYSLCHNAELHYSVMRSLFGDIKVIINNQENYRPLITFAVGIGCIPIKKENCIYTFDIPENKSAEKREVINIPKFKLPNNSYVRLMCSVPGYQLVADGNMRIK